MADHTGVEDLEEGPLSDDDGGHESQNVPYETPRKEGEDAGIPLKYLTPAVPAEIPPEAQFYPLQLEETVTTATNSSVDEREQQVDVSAKDRSELKLDLNLAEDKSQDIQEGEIIFSPGGSQAYMFTGADMEGEKETGTKPKKSQEKSKEKEEQKPNSGSTPREIDHPMFRGNRELARGSLPRGERPTTVGQSSDSPGPLATKSLSRVPKLPQLPGSPRRSRGALPANVLAERLDNMRLSLDMDLGTTTDDTAGPYDSSIESSPRVLPDVRRLSRIIPRDQFLQDPDSYNINLSEQEFTTGADTPGSIPLTPHGNPVIPPLHSDRATSPSVASVVSMASSTASGQNTGRRNLEWDPVFDMGVEGLEYSEGQPNAAHSLSELERLAIGNYSECLRTEPEGKPARDRKGVGKSSKGPQVKGQGQQRMTTEEEMRQMRLHKFADSLMRQRELRRLAAEASGSNSHSSPSQRQRKRSSSRESGRRRSDSNTLSESSPQHHGERRRSRKSRSRRNSPITRPMKSSSLSDLRDGQFQLEISGRHFRSNSDVSFNQIPSLPNAFKRTAPFHGSSEPSSCSSTHTVVPLKQNPEHDADLEHHDLLPINTDPQSLPLHIQGLFRRPEEHHSHRSSSRSNRIRKNPSPSRSRRHRLSASRQSKLNSQTSLSSRQSGSRSFETVINMGARSKISEASKNRWMTSDNLNSDNSPEAEEDTEDEIEAVRRQNEREVVRPRHKVIHAWDRPPQSDDDGVKDDENRHARLQRKHSSRNSSMATTSDDEKTNTREVNSEGGGGRKRYVTAGTNTATSTMESSQIDRAKSFEYFPGESFPMQENSSSYEYLPGHMVTDRPGTVVSNYRTEDGGVSGINTFSRSDSSTSSRYREHRGQDQAQVDGKSRQITEAMARRRIDLEIEQQEGRMMADMREYDLNEISDELAIKSKELMEAHLKKTKHFYKKMKKYIEVVSTPSLTTEDSRKKQAILDKLLKVMSKEEAKLIDSESFSVGFRTPIPIEESRIEDEVVYSADESDVFKSEPATRPLESGMKNGSKLDLPISRENKFSASTSDQSSMTLQTSTTEGEASLQKKEKANKVKKKRPKDNDNVAEEEALMHKKRIEQMRVLRREIKKLEKLECAELASIVRQNPSLSMEVENLEDSDLSTLASMSTCASSISERTSKKTSSKDGKAKGERKGLPGTFTRPKPIKTQENAQKKSSANSHHKQPIVSGSRTTKSLQIQSKRETTLVTSGRPQSGRQSQARKQEFGQTFPTPRDAETARPQPERRQPRHEPKVKIVERVPVAYYLPIGNASPIRIGKRIIASKGLNPEEGIGKENRSILANYVASLDENSVRHLGQKKRTESTSTSSTTSSRAEREARRREELRLYSLQDALAVKRPDFLQHAERRRHLLSRMRDTRLFNEEQRRRWIENQEELSPRTREANPPPTFVPAKVERIFNYKDMVRETREKYKRLPEIQQQVYDMKRKNSFKTNRIMKDMYKRKLQENVLKGRVSHNHHNNVV